MSNPMKHIIVHCQHRSGSTALSKTIADFPGVVVIPEEINLVERCFVSNTLWRYAQGKWHDSKNIHGSLWRSDGEFHERTAEIICDCRSWPNGDLGSFVEKVLDNLASVFDESHAGNVSSTSVACKYAVHVSFSKKLIESIPSAHHIILIRDLKSVYISKVNDPGMRALRRSNYLRYWAKRLAVLVFFALDYRTLIRLRNTADDKPNCYVIRYSQMENDLRNFAECAGFDFYSVKGIRPGKPSSMADGYIKPMRIELALLRYLGGYFNLD